MKIPFTLTRHAIDRALDMAVTGEEIRNCILHPETVYRSRKYENTTNYRCGRIILAVRDSAVVTVGWSTKELWCEDLDRGEYGGRHYPAKASGQGAQ